MAKKRKVKKSLKQISQKRLLFVLFLLSFVLVFIIGKLIYLQIFDVADQYEAQVDQSVDEVRKNVGAFYVPPFYMRCFCGINKKTTRS